jgi:hypothetical protein
MSFFFYKNGEPKDRIGPVLGVGTSSRGLDVGIWCRRMNMVQMLCTHLYKWKNETCLNHSKNEVRRDGGE